MGHKEAQLVLDTAEYTSGKLFLLYRIAELVNPHNDYRYFQHPESAADELNMQPETVRKYCASYAADGWLEVVEAGGGRGNKTEYRWSAETGTVVRVSPETATVVRQTATTVPQTATVVPNALLTREEREDLGREAVSVDEFDDRPLALTKEQQKSGSKKLAEIRKAQGK